MIQKLRIWALLLIHVLILLHIFIFGDEIVGSIDFQEFFHAFIKHGVLNAGAILVIIAFMTTLVFGRFFCGWACHFGAIQEFSWWLLKKININPITINSRLVTILPIILLLNYYFIPNLVYAYNNPWEVSIKLNEPEIWEFLPGWLIGILTFIIDGFLMVYFLGRKGFCRFLCPWGAFLKFPNSMSMFKVRKINACTYCHECTKNCPVGIDVSYEINKFNKVVNTNCTSCLVCTSGCPSNSLSYKFQNPLNETYSLAYFLRKSTKHHKNINHLFKSIKTKDFILLLLCLLFSISIDGLYGIGHFMAFGIGILSAFLLFVIDYKNIQLKIFINSFIILFFLWHGTIKFSIWQGVNYYNKKQFDSGIAHLEIATKLYPKKIGKFHLMLGDMYYLVGNNTKALEHAMIAHNINPSYNAPIEIINNLNK